MLKKLGNLMQTGSESGTQITIKNRITDEVLATGETPNGVFSFEGNWYFDAAQVAMDNLTITDRTYTCSYKGTCNWVDLETPQGKIPNVGWVYPEPKAGYEQIKDRIAFYDGTRSGTVAVTD